MLYLAFICGAGYVLWALLMKNNPVSRIAIFGFVNPVVNVLLSAVLNGEPLFRWQYLAALVFVCVGIWLVNKAPAKKGGQMTGPIFSTPTRTTAPAPLTPTAIPCWTACPARVWWACVNRPPTPGMHPKCAGAGAPLPVGGGSCWHPPGKPAARRRLRRGRPGSYGLGVRRRLGRRDACPDALLCRPQGGGSGGSAGWTTTGLCPRMPSWPCLRHTSGWRWNWTSPSSCTTATPMPTFTPCSKNYQPNGHRPLLFRQCR